MRWRTIVMVAWGVAVALHPLRDAAGQTAREQLHDVYRVLVEADTLTRLGDMEQAKALYREAIIDLERLQRAYPGWQREVVSARLAHARNRLTRLETGEYETHDDAADDDDDGVEDREPGAVQGIDLELAWRKEQARHQERLWQLRQENMALKARLRATQRMAAPDDAEPLIAEPVRERMARILVAESERLQLENQGDDARELLEAADRLLPDVFDIRLALGLIYCRENRFDLAARILRGVAAKNPDHTTARLALGAAWVGLDNLGAARAEIEAALDIEPDNPDAHYNMARLLVMLPDPEPMLARRHYQRSLSLGGDDDAALKALIQRKALEQFGRGR